LLKLLYMTAIIVEMTSNPSKNVEERQEAGHIFIIVSKKAVSGNAAISQTDLSVTHALCL
jgi:hypothetical protein